MGIRDSNDNGGHAKDAATVTSNAYLFSEEDETSGLEDWTSTLPVTEGTKFFKSIDWSTSTLGLPRTWPASLRFAVNLLFVDSRGASIYWGDERVAIYNEVYKPMAGQAHPNLMGKPFYVGYPELWANIRPIFDRMQATGLAIDVDNIELFTDRHGYNEEAYFIGQFIPLREVDGRVVGCYNTVYESTVSVIQVRRRAMINAIAAIPDCTLKELNDLIKQVMETNGRDVPMVMLYSLGEGNRTVIQQLQLQVNIGVQRPDQWVPPLANIAISDIGIVPHLRSAHERKTMILIQADDTTSNTISPLLNHVEWSGFGEPSKELLIAPLISAGNLLGFMIMGTNPRREFTDHCRQFVNDVALQIAGKWASAFTFEQAKAREERLVRNLEERERRVRYMAQCAPVGMLHLTVEGSLTWANQHYFDIMAYTPTEEAHQLPFLQSFSEEDQPIIRALWETLRGGASADCQARLKRIYEPPTAEKWRRTSTELSPAWLLVQGFPLKEEGGLELIMICFTDISGLKWAELVQSRVAAAAEMSRRQQEEFIDITSHEMRNPLSAIMQSAQAISTSLHNLQISRDQKELLGKVEEAIEAANTILSCGLYQKRIIDDVLMLSRLENEMLSITPAVVDPVNLLRNILKMLDGDVRSGDIQTKVIRHESLGEHKLENVFCDPSRLAQILTNLLSNAFKFTRQEKTRVTEITCGASLQIPTEEESMTSLQWSSSGKDRGDLTLRPEWGKDEVIYLYFLIRDTGSGLTQLELGRLFARFSQATTTTHLKHGGCGLGLYISRELAEKHGGQIGVLSTPGEGSTFAFYIKTRRARNTAPRPIDLPPAKVASPPAIMPSSEEDYQLSLHGVKERSYEVLLVEDNLINQRVLSRQLRNAGCVVHIANDGVEALEFLGESDSRWIRNGNEKKEARLIIDVILMDWNMPNLDGVSCTRRMRSEERKGNTQKPMVVIGITANARPEQLLEARDAGMDDVLSKPFLLEDLMAKIDELVVK